MNEDDLFPNSGSSQQEDEDLFPDSNSEFSSFLSAPMGGEDDTFTTATSNHKNEFSNNNSNGGGFVEETQNAQLENQFASMSMQHPSSSHHHHDASSSTSNQWNNYQQDQQSAVSNHISNDGDVEQNEQNEFAGEFSSADNPFLKELSTMDTTQEAVPTTTFNQQQTSSVHEPHHQPQQSAPQFTTYNPIPLHQPPQQHNVVKPPIQSPPPQQQHVGGVRSPHMMNPANQRMSPSVVHQSPHTSPNPSPSHWQQQQHGTNHQNQGNWNNQARQSPWMVQNNPQQQYQQPPHAFNPTQQISHSPQPFVPIQPSPSPTPNNNTNSWQQSQQSFVPKQPFVPSQNNNNNSWNQTNQNLPPNSGDYRHGTPTNNWQQPMQAHHQHQQTWQSNDHFNGRSQFSPQNNANWGGNVPHSNSGAFFGDSMHHQQHYNMPNQFGGHHYQQQHQQSNSSQFFQPPPALPIFRFGFGKTLFISPNSTQVTIYPGLTGVANNKPDITAALDIEDQNSCQNYLDFTVNSLLSNATKEQWELWQVVKLFVRHGHDQKVLREQVSQFLLSQSSRDQVYSPQVPVTYDENSIVPYLESGNVRGAIDEAMNRGMYAIAILLAQGWPELNLQQQVVHAVAQNAAPVLSSLLGYSGNAMNTDWRRTVALLLANECKTSGIGVIQGLGDGLWKDQNNVYSAHLCYLACGLLSAQKNDVLGTRVLLVGGDHKRNLKGFFDKETIERSMFISDVLNSPKFQPFKLVYAYYLISHCGNYELAQKCLKSIPQNMLYNPQFQYQHELLTHRLKAVMSKSGGRFFRGGKSGGVTNWLFKSFENLIHGDDVSPTGAAQAPVQQQMQALSSQTPPMQTPPPVEMTPPPQQQQPRQSQPSEEAKPPQETNLGESSKKSGSWFGGLFGAKKKNEVSLGRDNEFEYCSIRKRWVPKGQAGKVTPEELAEEQRKMAPPDLSSMSFLSGNTPSISQRGGYVDLFNSNGNVPTSSSPVPPATTLQTPPLGGMARNHSSPNLSQPPPMGKFFIPNPAAASNNGTGIPHSAPVSPQFRSEPFNPMTPSSGSFVPDQSGDGPSYVPPQATNGFGHHHVRSHSVPNVNEHPPMNN